MSNKQNNQQPQRLTPQQAVTEASRILEVLKADRERLAVKAVEFQDVVRRNAFNAHAMHDVEASRELSVARTESLGVDQRLREHDAAVAEAEQRLLQARQVEAKAADAEQAKALRKAVREFVEAGRRVDHALGLLARDGHALVDAHAQLTRLGCAFPSGTQLVALGDICLRSAIMSTPWARSVETVAPNQRRSFRGLIEGWASNIEANNIKPRLGEQTNEAA